MPKLEFTPYKQLPPYKMGFKDGYNKGQQDLINNILEIYKHNKDAIDNNCIQYTVNKFNEINRNKRKE